VLEIRQELVKRRDLDQTVRKDAAQKARLPEVDTDNFHYLEGLVQEVGWIDSTRFGKPASAAAILLAKHGNDPRLMQAVLPFVEEDVKRGAISGELFSVLYDGCNSASARSSATGPNSTKIRRVLSWCRWKTRASRRSAEGIGLPPLTEYLATASRALFAGKPIRILSED